MRNLYVAFGLLVTTAATAQPRISVDSVALFQVAEDQYKQGRELVRAKGFVSQFKAHEDGHVEVGVFRQHVGYLTTEKGSGIKTGPNTVPALQRIDYREGNLRPQDEQFANLGTSLIKPFPYRLQTIIGQTGGIQTEKTTLTDNTTATDYAQLLREQAVTLDYQGDLITQSSMAVQMTAFVVQQTRYQYVPFANKYLSMGQPTVRTYPLTSRRQPNFMLYDAQGTMTYHQAEAGQLITLDTLGRTVQTLALEGLADKRLIALSGVTDQNPATVVSAVNFQQRVGADWLFGPAENKAKNPELVLIRTDARGNVVFRHAFTVGHEDYGLAQAAIVSNATDALVIITLGKGLLKYVMAYTKLNAGGVAFQREWDKQDPAQTVRVNGGGSAFKAFTDVQQLITLPNDENLLVSYDADHSPSRGATLIGYGALHLSAKGDMLRYYSLRTNTSPALNATLPQLRVLGQPDGRVMMWVNEPRNTQVAQFSAFSLLDTELQAGGLPNGTTFTPGQPSVLVNLKTNGLRPASSSLAQAGGLMGGLGRLADRAAAARSSLGLSELGSDEPKHQEQFETSPFNSSPVLYWIDTQAGTALMRDFGNVGYSLPNQPFVVVNRTRNEAYMPLRTALQSTQGPRSGRYPRAVYFKLARLNW